MGGYGRSKLREFILGGATQHLLQEPNVAIMLSH
jgi:nucleotide-binding universal stress UspA family protein